MSLDEATKENGCMWGIPGSHDREPKHFMVKRKDAVTGRWKTVHENAAEVYEYNIEGAVPLEVGPGSIVLLHGNVLHYSEPN